MGYQPKISLTMIVKNEERTLKQCLDSVKDLVDEMVVVDTGSDDNTRAIAEAAGAKVYDYSWQDHFADARNESLKYATGDWIFWLDGDEYFDEENHQKLKELFASLKDENIVYLTHQVNTIKNAPGEEILFARPSLFRNRPDIRWRYRVHEQILPVAQETGAQAVYTDIRLLHPGYHEPEVHQRKVERNIRLLHIDDNDNPNDPFILFHLGLMYQSIKRYAEALPYWPVTIKLLVPGHSMASKAYYLWAEAHSNLGQLEQAVRVCQEGLNRFPDYPELLLFQARILAAAGRIPESEHLLQQLLQGPRGNPNQIKASFNTGIYSFQPLLYLGEICAQTNRLAEAEQHFKAALNANPTYLPALKGLANLYQVTGRKEEYESVYSQIQELISR